MMKKLLLIFSLSIFLNLNALQAQELSARETQIAIYPQPAVSQLNIAFDIAQQSAPRVLVYDLLGNLVADMEAERNENGVYSIYLGDKKPGYYFLKIQGDTETFSRRITLKP
jgi:hypothetical protein